MQLLDLPLHSEIVRARLCGFELDTDLPMCSALSRERTLPRAPLAVRFVPMSEAGWVGSDVRFAP
jgi:hypothetical protein